MRKNHKNSKIKPELARFNRFILGCALSLFLLFVMNGIDYICPQYAGFIFWSIIMVYISFLFLVVRRQKRRSQQENLLA